MKISKVICVLVLVLGLISSAFSAELKRSAKIEIIVGEAEIIRTGGTAWLPAEVGMTLSEGEAIRVKTNSCVLLKLNGDNGTASIELKESSQLTFVELRTDEEGIQRTFLDLALGQALIKAHEMDMTKSKFQVKTPTSIVDVKEAKLSIAVEALE